MRRLVLGLACACAIGPLAAPARATITPDAAKVVRRYLEVTGGAAAFAAESTSYTHAKISAFGFDGTFASWYARPSRRYSRTELGPFKLSEGVSGATAWRTDPTTGVVRPLADHDLDQALASAWFEGERWAEPGEGGGSVVLAGHERDSLGTYTVLAVTAPDLAGGRRPLSPHQLWFDDKTGLLAVMRSKDDQREVFTRVSDWRLAAGRKRSFVNESGVESMPANTVKAIADTLLANLSVSGLPFSAPQAASSSGPAPVTWLGSQGTAKLPFDYRARHVWLKASVNGGPAENFLFDTGASVTVIDSGWAATHGLKTEGRMQAAGAGAAGGASFATLGSLRIASAAGDGVELKDVKVAVLDVDPSFEPMFWRSMAGVIGYDVISRFVVTLDYDDSVLVLHDPATFKYAGTDKPLPMIMNGTVPAVTGKLDDTDEGLFRLDVGSSSTVDVHAPFAKKTGLLNRMGKTTRFDGVGFGGSFSSDVGRLKSMSLGPYTWDDPVVTVSHATEGAFASEEFAGNIGNRILERFEVTFDYERRQVYLEPGKRYADRDHLTRAGLLLTKRDGKVSVESVLANSPAERCGLRPGDQVLSVADRDIATWDLPQITALLDDGEPGLKVPVRILRGGQKKQVQMKLAEVVR
jgi:hypothetical protein